LLLKKDEYERQPRIGLIETGEKAHLLGEYDSVGDNAEMGLAL
jgi:hypothetical protein